MGDDLRNKQRNEAHDDSGDPTQTGPRARSLAVRMNGHDPSASGEIERSALPSLRSDRPEGQTGWQLPRQSLPAVRPRVRPSAFGLPRASQPDALHPHREIDVAPRERESVPPQPSRAAQSAPQRLSQTVRKRGSNLPPPVKTDIEELLPISHGVKSLPRPPKLPGFETPQLPLAASRRFPWASLAVFVVMLGASFIPLTHYRGERQVAAKAAEERDLLAEAEDATSTAGLTLAPLGDTAVHAFAPHATPVTISAVDRVERAFWGRPSRVRESLLQAGERALAREQESLAESLFVRALEFDGDFDGDDARAEYGLSRARLSQGDLDGAEVFVLTTIRKAPRRAEYRALHAEILQRRGRGPEAQLERVVARALAHFSRGTRGR